MQNFQNEKSFLDEIKSIFHSYLRTIIWCKKWKIADTSFIKNIHRADPELWECIIFRIKMAYCPKQNIFLEKVLCFWSTYCPYSLWKIWRKWLEPISKKVKIYGIPSKISANIYPCKSLPLLKLILHKNWCPQ